MILRYVKLTQVIANLSSMEGPLVLEKRRWTGLAILKDKGL